MTRYNTDLRSAEERFWSKVDRRGFDECWPWLRAADKDGYGHFWVRAGELDVPLTVRTRQGAKGKSQQANRVAFRLVNGYWPERALHGCDNPGCCNAENPLHVHEGTPSQNALEMFARDRQPARMRAGETHYRAQHSDAQVAEIKARYAAGGVSQRVLAQEYGVQQSTISRYVNGVRYGGVG